MPGKQKKRRDRPALGHVHPMHPRAFGRKVLDEQITRFPCERCGTAVHLVRGGFLPIHSHPITGKMCQGGHEPVGLDGSRLVHLKGDRSLTGAGIEARARFMSAVKPRGGEGSHTRRRTSTSVIGTRSSRPGDVSSGLPGNGRRR